MLLLLCCCLACVCVCLICLRVLLTRKVLRVFRNNLHRAVTVTRARLGPTTTLGAARGLRPSTPVARVGCRVNDKGGGREKAAQAVSDLSDEAPAPPDKDDSSPPPPPVATPKKRQRRDTG